MTDNIVINPSQQQHKLKHKNVVSSFCLRVLLRLCVCVYGMKIGILLTSPFYYGWFFKTVVVIKR